MLGMHDKVENNPEALVKDARFLRKKFKWDSEYCGRSKTFKEQKDVFMGCIKYIATLTTS